MPANEEEVLEVLANAEDAPLSTTQIADALGISQPGAWRRLEKLAEADLVTRIRGEDTAADTWTLSDDVKAALEE